jgi:hypothetical protein
MQPRLQYRVLVLIIYLTAITARLSILLDSEVMLHWLFSSLRGITDISLSCGEAVNRWPILTND